MFMLNWICVTYQTTCQKFGEVDPEFASEFADQLSSVWSVMDYRYDVHHLTYNGTRLLTFFYHGGDLFGIVQNVPIEKNSDIPFLHSRASVEHHTANFFVRLSSDSVDSPYLSIFCDFEDFISFKIKDVILCCDDGKMTTMSIASTEKPFRTTSIGLGWGDLCVANKFNPALNFRIIVV
ncbi:hypothetical protein QL285_014483 [Trifolium repens]|nr:hypothetical protein QL285_014483 [Trifolium repens]